MLHYNVLIWGARQPGWSLADVDTPPLPVTRRYPVSDAAPRRRLALTVSLLLHVAVACAVTIWLRHRPPASRETEQPVEMVFQPSPAEAAQETPQTPQQEAALVPPEPPPAPPQPAETTLPPAPLVPPPPVAAAPEVRPCLHPRHRLSSSRTWHPGCCHHRCRRPRRLALGPRFTRCPRSGSLFH
jgi:hypothetical protein